MQVRVQAQKVLSSCVDSFLYAGRKILPDILAFLKSDSGISHEQFKVMCKLFIHISIRILNVTDNNW